MKTAHIDLANPEYLKLAKIARRRGEKLAALTKFAADAETVAYWSEYFGAYGTQFVRPLALKKSARMASIGGKEAWGSEDDAWYEEELKKEKTKESGIDDAVASLKDAARVAELSDDDQKKLDEVLKTVQDLKSKSPVDQAQTMYDVSVHVEAEPFVTLMPDAFEHSFKFALEALKADGAASLSVEHIMTDVGQAGEPGASASMTGDATCAVALTSSDLAAFVATVESQLKKYLEDADFPCAVITCEEPMKRVANRGCIMEDARNGVSLARMVARFGEARARVAKRCAAKEATGIAYSPVARALVKRAQAKIEEADNISFTGDPSSEGGAVADLGAGISAQIKYMGTQLPNGFQWVITKGEDFLAHGEEEMFEQAKGSVQSERPKATSKALSKDAALRRAMIDSVGPVAFYERLASVNGLDEYRVTKKTGSVVWLSVRAGKVENKVGEL